MKKLIILITAAITVCSTVKAQETPPPYVVLATGDQVSGEHWIDVPEGYIVEMLTLDLKTGTSDPGIPGNYWTYSFCEVQGDYGNNYNFNIVYTSETSPSSLPKFLSPVRIEVHSNGGQSEKAIVCLKITEVSDTSVIPTNTVVIPADASGPVEIILESSEDLITWTPASSGSYGASTSKRFFRVRTVVSAE